MDEKDIFHFAQCLGKTGDPIVWALKKRIMNLERENEMLKQIIYNNKNASEDSTKSS